MNKTIVLEYKIDESVIKFENAYLKFQKHEKRK